jgi:hypothetical protein
LAQEYRGGVGINIDLTKKLSTEIEFEMRKVFYPESHFNKTFQGKLEYSLTDFCGVAASYTYSSIKEQEDDYEEEGTETTDKSKFTADLNFQPGRFHNDLKITNRFRYQYAITDESESTKYLRNKVSLDYRINKTMSSYVAVEPYYQLKSQRINQLRIYIGTEMPVLGTKMEIYYITEVKFKEEFIRTFYIVGASFKINYKKANK